MEAGKKNVKKVKSGEILHNSCVRPALNNGKNFRRSFQLIVLSKL